MCYNVEKTDAAHFRRCVVRFYHFFMKFLRSFGIGFGVGGAAALTALGIGWALLRAWMGEG